MYKGSPEDKGTNTWQHTFLMIPKTDKLHQNREKMTISM